MYTELLIQERLLLQMMLVYQIQEHQQIIQYQQIRLLTLRLQQINLLVILSLPPKLKMAQLLKQNLLVIQ
ncbi:MAG: hypothetical protein EBV64_14470 [Oxalobacteraceae bacterium]|nr:hypothetical protein [Oxalobacteraceae bacterium]